MGKRLAGFVCVSSKMHPLNVYMRLCRILSSRAARSTRTVGEVTRPLAVLRAAAQNPDLQQKLTAVKESAAKNKQALSQYTWQEKQTTTIKGDVKGQKLFQVRLGPDGKPQKTEVMGMPQSEGGGRGPERPHKREESRRVQRIRPADCSPRSVLRAARPARLQQAFQQGNVMLGPAGGPGIVKMVIKNYVKPNDQVTLVFNQQEKAIQSMQIQSYLSDPKDEVTIAAQYSKLPDGTNHVSTMQINGVSKALTVTSQNSNYQKM